MNLRTSISLLFCYLFAALASSCSNYEKDADVVTSNVLEVEIKDLPDTSDILLSEFCSCSEYISLELSQSSRIGEVSHISVTNNGDYLVFDERVNSVAYRFDSLGNFLNTIGRVGRQESEHSQTITSVYDKYRDQVIVWDHKLGKIKYYSLDGEHLHSDDSDWRSGTFAVLDEDRFLFYIDVSDWHQHCYDFRYRIVSKDTYEIEKEMQDPDIEYQSRKLLTLPDFFYVSDTLFLKGMHSNSVYKIKDDEMIPACRISYDGPTIKPPKKRRNDIVEYISRLEKRNKNFAFCYKVLVSQKYFFVVSASDRLFNISLFDCNDHKRVLSGRICRNDLLGERVIFDDKHRYPCAVATPSWISGDVCYFVIVPSLLHLNHDKQEVIDSLVSNVNDVELRNQLIQEWSEFYKVRDNDNPVLLKCTLK